MSPSMEAWGQIRRVLIAGLTSLFVLLALLVVLGFYADYQARHDSAAQGAKRRYATCVQTAKARRSVIGAIWLNAAEAQSVANELKINPALAGEETTIAGIYIQQASQLNALQPKAFAFHNTDPLPGVSKGQLGGIGKNLAPVGSALGESCGQQSKASSTPFFSLN